MKNGEIIRLIFFMSTLIFISIWEILYPRRTSEISKSARWINNIGIAMVYSLLDRWIFPVSVVGLTIISKDNNWGLMNNVEIPYWAGLPIGIVALDFVIYTQHVLFHFIPALWRLHMVHHSDLDFDVSTGIRFHPIEIIISTGIKLATIILIGHSALTAFIFIILLNVSSMFTHGNVRIAPDIDRIIRLFLVTPDMHRVHHSIFRSETNSNFGFLLPWWDYLFGTYRKEPDAGHINMTIGLNNYRDIRHLSLLKLLAMPFAGDSGWHSTNLNNKNI